MKVDRDKLKPLFDCFFEVLCSKLDSNNRNYISIVVCLSDESPSLSEKIFTDFNQNSDDIYLSSYGSLDYLSQIEGDKND